ncbi:MAG: DUF6240 domain-containing protein [Clostridiales bacterium]|jgi:hypothetical protein|nr:DUF6240 domain-containing protein [Clostridiales bacterium]
MRGPPRARTAARSQVYENFAAAPEKKYGDSFARVQEQFDDLLAYLQIPVTAENLQAASALSRGGMDVNPKNLDRAKSLLERFQRMMDNLHPCIVISIIQDGLNPLDMHIDGVLQYIAHFDGEYGGGHGDKIAARIVGLDKSREMEPATRKKVVELYQTLNAIQKSEAAFGAIFKLEKQPTLGNLLAAARAGQYQTERMTKRADRDEHSRLIHFSDAQKHGQASRVRYAQTLHGRQDQQRER